MWMEFGLGFKNMRPKASHVVRPGVSPVSPCLLLPKASLLYFLLVILFAVDLLLCLPAARPAKNKFGMPPEGQGLAALRASADKVHVVYIDVMKDDKFVICKENT